LQSEAMRRSQPLWTITLVGSISEADPSSFDGSGSFESCVPHLGMSVWIDLGSDHLTCLHWTQYFALLFQTSPQGAGFLHWILQKQRHAFLEWLQSEAMRRSQPLWTITLVVPAHGNDQREDKVRKTSLTCTAVEGAETLPVNLPSHLSSPGVRVVRLDMQKSRIGQWSRWSRQFLGDSIHALYPTILLWVEMQTRDIMKSTRAPSSMFRVGNSLVVSANAHQEDAADHNLFGRIENASTKMQWREPATLGTYTLVSGGYKLRAEITLVDWGEVWEGKDEKWWLLSLRRPCLLGTVGRVKVSL